MSDSDEKHWLEDLLYFLVTTQRFDLCYILHNVNIVSTSTPIAFCGPYPIPAACCLTDAGQLQISLYWPILKYLSFEARLELLEHEAAHITEGHFSSYGKMLGDTYGPVLANMAMDIYVNQQTARSHLEKEGLPGLTLEQFPGLPPNLSSLQYADLLQKLAQEDKLTVPDLKQPTDALLTGTAAQSDKLLPFDAMKHIMSEMLQLTDAQAVFADERARSIITSVTEALKMHGDDALARWRGRTGADHEELMKASERQATVPWSHHLRVMEEQHQHMVRTETRRRPSRRNPAYRGYTWTGGLEIAVLIDTSGSMGAEELTLIDPELRGMKARGARIVIIHSDTDVAKVHLYNSSEPLERFFGRGGTDYSNALMQLRQLHPRPHYLIGYTDGYGGIERYKATIIKERSQSWWDAYCATNPERSPDGFSTLWLLPAGCMPPDDFKREIVPWGKTIIVEKDRS